MQKLPWNSSQTQNYFFEDIIILLTCKLTKQYPQKARSSTTAQMEQAGTPTFANTTEDCSPKTAFTSSISLNLKETETLHSLKLSMENIPMTIPTTSLKNLFTISATGQEETFI